MEEEDIVAGSRMMERVASTSICERNFSRHLSDASINQHFRAMFGVSSRTAHLLWITLDIDVIWSTWWETNPSSMDVNVFEGVLHPRQFKWNMWCYEENFLSMGRCLLRSCLQPKFGKLHWCI